MCSLRQFRIEDVQDLVAAAGGGGDGVEFFQDGHLISRLLRNFPAGTVGGILSLLHTPCNHFQQGGFNRLAVLADKDELPIGTPCQNRDCRAMTDDFPLCLASVGQQNIQHFQMDKTSIKDTRHTQSLFRQILHFLSFPMRRAEHLPPRRSQSRRRHSVPSRASAGSSADLPPNRSC